MAPVGLRKAGYPIQEFELIRALRRRFAPRESALVRGIGDDAAVIATIPRQWWHVTTDLLLEGVHFDLRTTSPRSVGYRAAMANLSDLAGMGAVPRYLFTSIAIPKQFKASQVAQLYGGLMTACHKHGVVLAGGDTSASKAGLFLCITLIGTTAPRHALLRSGARVGDGIYVTGTLGDSLSGLRILTRRPRPRILNHHYRFLINRHLHPTARIQEGQWLNAARLAHAAIDLSDGLSGDLRHICEESRVGAVIELDALPLSSSCRAYAKASHQDPIQLALAGGEDYELLFTVSPDKERSLVHQANERGYHMTRIGTIRSRGSGIRMRLHNGRPIPLPMTSYEHFRS